MKAVVSRDVARAAELRAIQAGISQEMLMEKAGVAVAHQAKAIIEEYQLPARVVIVCGSGNNGADGYAAARILLSLDILPTVYQLYTLDEKSLCKKQRRRFEARGGKVIDCNESLLYVSNDCLVIDAIFGIGLSRSLDTKASLAIQTMNTQAKYILSIDIPSGIDANTGEIFSTAICAHATITFDAPKQGYFLQEAWNNIGAVHVVPIGLKPYIPQPTIQMVEKSDILALLPRKKRTIHKYQAGYVVGIDGEHGMQGASTLATLAALKSGSGVVHLLTTSEKNIPSTHPDIVRIHIKSAEDAKPYLDKADSIFIGPGLLGFKENPHQTALFHTCIEHYREKTVFDAESFTLLGNAPQLPLSQSILTPHRKELEVLTGISSKAPLSADFFEKCQNYADEKECILVVKGAPTLIFMKNKPITIMPYGTPALAKAGSGDILTGIIASMRAQGLSHYDSVVVATTLHALAGEEIAYKNTVYAVTASEVIDELSTVFRKISL